MGLRLVGKGLAGLRSERVAVISAKSTSANAASANP